MKEMAIILLKQTWRLSKEIIHIYENFKMH